jgi:methyl-accepting chemotaxis protein
LIAIGTALAIAVLYMMSREATTVSFVHARVKIMTTADFLLPFMVQTLLIMMAFVSVAAIAVTLVVSHKIAGPLYRFRQAFKELAGGNFSEQVRLRKGDQLVEVAGDINQMITAVQIRIADIRDNASGIKAGIDSVGAASSDDDRRRKIDDLQQKVSALGKTLEFFKV